MSDDYIKLWFRTEFRLGMAISDPRRMMLVPEEDLPEPLRAPARELREARSKEERTAAAKKFLALSQEWMT